MDWIGEFSESMVLDGGRREDFSFNNHSISFTGTNPIAYSTCTDFDSADRSRASGSAGSKSSSSLGVLDSKTMREASGNLLNLDEYPDQRNGANEVEEVKGEVEAVESGGEGEDEIEASVHLDRNDLNALEAHYSQFSDEESLAENENKSVESKWSNINGSFEDVDYERHKDAEPSTTFIHQPSTSSGDINEGKENPFDNVNSMVHEHLPPMEFPNEGGCSFVEFDAANADLQDQFAVNNQFQSEFEPEVSFVSEAVDQLKMLEEAEKQNLDEHRFLQDDAMQVSLNTTNTSRWSVSTEKPSARRPSWLQDEASAEISRVNASVLFAAGSAPLGDSLSAGPGPNRPFWGTDFQSPYRDNDLPILPMSRNVSTAANTIVDELSTEDEEEEDMEEENQDVVKMEPSASTPLRREQQQQLQQQQQQQQDQLQQQEQHKHTQHDIYPIQENVSSMSDPFSNHQHRHSHDRRRVSAEDTGAGGDNFQNSRNRNSFSKDISMTGSTTGFRGPENSSGPSVKDPRESDSSSVSQIGDLTENTSPHGRFKSSYLISKTGKALMTSAILNSAVETTTSSSANALAELISKTKSSLQTQNKYKHKSSSASPNQANGQKIETEGHFTSHSKSPMFLPTSSSWPSISKPTNYVPAEKENEETIPKTMLPPPPRSRNSSVKSAASFGSSGNLPESSCSSQTKSEQGIPQKRAESMDQIEKTKAVKANSNNIVLESNKHRLVFGVMEMGETSMRKFSLKNASSQTLKLKVSFKYPKPGFQVGKLRSGKDMGHSWISLEGGETRRISVAFHPATPSTHLNKLLFGVHNTHYKFAFPLYGQGCDTRRTTSGSGTDN